MTIKKLLIISSIIFLIILIICLITLLRLNLSFINSLFPEVFGFALEGLIVVGLLSLIQLSIENKRKKDEKLKLKSSLRALSAHFLYQTRLIAYQHEGQFEPYEMTDSTHNSILKLLDQFGTIEDINMGSHSIIELRDYLQVHKSQLEAALPIAALISPLAVVSWQGFLMHINNFLNSKNSASMFNAVESLRWLGSEDAN